MEIRDFLAANAVLELRESDRWRVIKEMGRHAATLTGLHPEEVVTALVAREKLGSTALGSGIALPHARIDGLDRPFGLFAVLRPAVQFDAIDEQPVDLVVLILLPVHMAEGQLRPMACAARRLRDTTLTAKLRKTRGAAALYDLLADPP